MKKIDKAIASTITVCLATAGFAATVNYESVAQAQNSVKFFCDTNSAEPIVTASSSDPNILVGVVIWPQKEIPGYDPTKLCQETATRFQAHYQSGNLTNLTTGAIDGESTICVAAPENQSCATDGLLFTLKYKKGQPQEVLRQLKDILAFINIKTEPKSEAAPSGLNQALAKGWQTAVLVQSAETRSEWKDVVSSWKKAISQLEAISPDHADYQQAQSKSNEYKGYLNYAQIRLDKFSANYFRQAINHGSQAANLTQSATTSSQWNSVVRHWKNAINLLEKISSQSPKHQLAQLKVKEYKSKLNYAKQMKATEPANLFREAINQSSQAVKLGQSAQSDSDWDKVVSNWQNAIFFLKEIPISSNKYEQAKKKINEYQGYLEYAQHKLGNR